MTLFELMAAVLLWMIIYAGAIVISHYIILSLRRIRIVGTNALRIHFLSRA